MSMFDTASGARHHINWEQVWMCQRCDGGGEIAWNPSPFGDPQDVETATCPRCDGSGAEPDEQATTEEEHDGR